MVVVIVIVLKPASMSRAQNVSHIYFRNFIN